MATGIRVIGGSQDGSRDALCDGALGTLVNPENAEELTSAILAALDDPARTGDRTSRFKPDLFADHLNALLNWSLLERAGSLAPRMRPRQKQNWPDSTRSRTTA